jgi:hypothetical protein
VAFFEMHGYAARGVVGTDGMFIVESRSAKAARKSSRLMFFALLLFAGPWVLGTMHFYIKPRKPIPPGFRILGLPRPKARN